MTGMLASVNSLSEALQVLAAKVDIIDLKEPSRGALGALDVCLVREIVQVIQGRCPVSATVGDLPMHAETLAAAVAVMAATGVDFVKIGFFPDGDYQAIINALAASAQGCALIAVLFADKQPDFALLPALKAAGFAGVMLDTMDKASGPLTALLAAEEIQAFITQARNLRLLCGLAGSLRRGDVANLLPYQADYLGFRGALCEQHNRVAEINPVALMAIRQLIA